MIEVDLSFPPPEVRPNARVHWAERAVAVKAYREEAGWLGKQALILAKRKGPLTPPVQAQITFYVARRQHDGDNLLASLKPVWDGFVDVRLLEGDRAHQLTIATPVVALREKGEPQGVHIRLREAGRD